MRKYKRFVVIIAIFSFLLLLYALTYIPKHFITIAPENVSKIVVFDGNTGNQLEVTNQQQIQHIVLDLNDVIFQKDKLSIGYMGYRFNTTIYDHKGKVIKELIINSEDTIRYKGFFYTAKNKPMDYNYINQLFVGTDTDKVNSETKVEDITFKHLKLPSDFMLKRELTHDETDVQYHLYEYEVTASLEEIDDWIRNESARLGAELIERYTYDIDEQLRLDIILKLPSSEGTTIISTYTSTYMEKQYIVFEETVFQEAVEIDQNYEDHAVIVYLPLENGLTEEVFLGQYAHQHTDIFVGYFYSHAFFAQLDQRNADLTVQYDMISGDVDYAVGYFDQLGDMIDPYSITEDNVQEVVYGIQMNNDLLSKLGVESDRILFYWAKTLLIGDRAHSRVYDGTEQINFLVSGKVIKSVTIEEVLMEG